MLSSSCGRAVGVAADVDKFVGFALLSAPLQIVVDSDVGHTEVGAHVLLVGVPLAEVFRALIVMPEGKEASYGETPLLPVVGEGQRFESVSLHLRKENNDKAGSEDTSNKRRYSSEKTQSRKLRF